MNYMVTKCSFFNVTLLGNSVRASKAFPVGFFCAVPGVAWPRTGLPVAAVLDVGLVGCGGGGSGHGNHRRVFDVTLRGH